MLDYQIHFGVLQIDHHSVWKMSHPIWSTNDCLHLASLGGLLPFASYYLLASKGLASTLRVVCRAHTEFILATSTPLLIAERVHDQWLIQYSVVQQYNEFQSPLAMILILSVALQASRLRVYLSNAAASLSTQSSTEMTAKDRIWCRINHSTSFNQRQMDSTDMQRREGNDTLCKAPSSSRRS